MKLFAKKIFPLTTFVKSSIFDIRQGSEYASALFLKEKIHWFPDAILFVKVRVGLSFQFTLQ